MKLIIDKSATNLNRIIMGGEVRERLPELPDDDTLKTSYNLYNNYLCLKYASITSVSVVSSNSQQFSEEGFKIY